MLQEIGELYANEIQRLNEMGENDLEITELPLKAKTLHKEVWKQGAEPGGDNAFADNTYIEKVNMAILKKPMKASEVKASQEGLTGGKTWDEYKTEKKATVKEYFDQKIADETQKYEERAVKAATKAKEKYIKDAMKVRRYLRDLGCSGIPLEDACNLVLEGEANKGITYSNVDIRKTVVVIGWATSKAEYMNSLSHEMLHVVQHISEQFLINMYGEEVCYLLGGLVQAAIIK